MQESVANMPTLLSGIPFLEMELGHMHIYKGFEIN